jgi:ribosomal-protein-alanine N-acetyltransferase
VSAAAEQELVLSRARTDDLPEILAIENASYPNPWSQGLFLQELGAPASRMLVARLSADAGSPIIGYVCRSFAADEVHVLNLAVHPAHRQRGIGRRLLETVIDEARARHAEAVYLEVRDTNRAATCLYRSANFTPAGRRRDYYGQGKDAVIMVLRLAAGGK